MEIELELTEEETKKLDDFLKYHSFSFDELVIMLIAKDLD